MKKILSACVAAFAVVGSLEGAVVQYTLTGTGDGGSTGSGTFSFDDTVVGADYDNIYAQGDFLSFSVTLNIAGGTPSTATFDLTTVGGEVFVLTKASGAITDFNPGGQSSGYSLSPTPYNMGVLTGNSINETIYWSYAVVPEPGTYAAVAGGALGAFAWVRRLRQRRAA